MPSHPSILHVLPRDGVGGVEVAARSMLDREDIACTFRLLILSGESLSSENKAVVTTGYSRALGARTIWSAVRIAITQQPDVLVLSLWRSVPVGLVFRQCRPRSRIAFLLHSNRPTHLLDRLFSRLGVLIADEIWADSEATLRSRAVPSSAQTRVISFVMEKGVGAPPAFRAPEPRFVTWSRLAREKGTDRAIEFIALLRAVGVNATFDIWGPDGGHLSELTRLVEQHSLGESVRFRGPARREAIPEISQQNSFFLQLSRQEGMGMGTVEAMQHGLVPIATAVGEMKNYVVPGETGVIVKPEDPGAAIAMVERLLSEPSLFNNVRSNCLAYWRDAPSYAQDFCAAARDLAARNRSG